MSESPNSVTETTDALDAALAFMVRAHFEGDLFGEIVAALAVVALQERQKRAGQS